MYFLRWITSHPILSILLVTLLYALFNIQNLGHWFGGEPKSTQVTHSGDTSAGGDASTTVVAAEGSAQSAAGATPASSDAAVAAKQPSDGATVAATAPSEAAVTAEASTRLFDLLRGGRTSDQKPSTDTASATTAEAADSVKAPSESAAATETTQPATVEVAESAETTIVESATVTETAQPVPVEVAESAKATVAESATATEPAQPATEATTQSGGDAAAQVAATESAEKQPKSLFDFFRKSQEGGKAEDGGSTQATAQSATPDESASTVTSTVAQGPSDQPAVAASVTSEPAATSMPTASADVASAATAVVATAATAVVETAAEPTPSAEAAPTAPVAPAPPASAEAAVAAAQPEPAAAIAAGDESRSKSWLDFLKRDKAEVAPAANDAKVDVAAKADGEAATATTETAAAPAVVTPSGAVDTVAPGGETRLGVSSTSDRYAPGAVTPEAPAAAVGVPSPEVVATAGTTDQVATERRKQLVQTLLEARQSFWKRDFATAETIYRNLVAAEPDNADVLGEFGNMLVQAGKAPEALDYYEKAANLLIEQNRLRDVHPLVGFIGHLDRERATAIIEKVRTLPRQ